MSAAITFYTNPMSRGRIARWMLEEVGEPYETRIVEFKPEGKAALRTVNPMGKVPTIVHDGHTVTEAAAICAYLADAFPDAKLAPATDRRADYYRWLFFAAGPLEAATTNRALGIEVPTDRERMVGYGNYGDVMDALEKAVSGKKFIAADHFTAADLYVGSHIGWGLHFGSIEKRDAFVDYNRRLSERPAFKRAWAKDEEAGQQLEAQRG